MQETDVLFTTPDGIRIRDLEDAVGRIENMVYGASELFELLEFAGPVRGNGHHIRQQVAAFAGNLMRERWIGTRAQAGDKG